MNRTTPSTLMEEQEPIPPHRSQQNSKHNVKASTSRYCAPEEMRQYAELKRTLREKGYFQKQPGYYVTKILQLLGFLILSISLLCMVQNFGIQLFNAIFLAFITTQLGLLGHDAGHRQIFSSRWGNRVLGLITGNLLLGISNAYWIEKHDRHHSHPNQVDMDPDLDIPLLIFDEQDIQKRAQLARWIIAHQDIFFFPILTLTFIHLQKESIFFLVQQKVKNHVVEMLLITIHYITYSILLFYLFAPWQALLFIIIHHGLTGVYMGSIFAPNHKGMPMLRNDEKLDFLHRQVKTARNVKAHPFTDFWYGGLNYQIEHHLFPTMPRNKLREAQVIIRDFCISHDIAYTETSFIQSYKEILHHLRAVSEPVRTKGLFRQQLKPM